MSNSRKSKGKKASVGGRKKSVGGEKGKRKSSGRKSSGRKSSGRKSSGRISMPKFGASATFMPSMSGMMPSVSYNPSNQFGMKPQMNNFMADIDLAKEDPMFVSSMMDPTSIMSGIPNSFGNFGLNNLAGIKSNQLNYSIGADNFDIMGSQSYLEPMTAQQKSYEDLIKETPYYQFHSKYQPINEPTLVSNMTGNKMGNLASFTGTDPLYQPPPSLAIIDEEIIPGNKPISIDIQNPFSKAKYLDL